MTEDSEEIAIFYTGQHRALSGQHLSVTEEDLDRVAASYDKDNPAPLVIGHPELDAPAHGWVTELRRSGARLIARVGALSPELRAANRAGRYRRVSAKFSCRDGKICQLLHIGMLGASRPALEKLPPVSFAEVAFAVPLVSHHIPSPHVSPLMPDQHPPNPQFSPSAQRQFAPLQDEHLQDEHLQDEHLQDDQLQNREQRLRARELAFAAQLKAHHRATAHTVIQSHIAQGKVLPNEAQLLTTVVAALSTAEFSHPSQPTADHAPAATATTASEATAPEATASDAVSTAPAALEALLQFLQGLPQRVPFAEHSAFASAEDSRNPISLARAISDRVSQAKQSGQPISYSAALAQLKSS